MMSFSSLGGVVVTTCLSYGIGYRMIHLLASVGELNSVASLAGYWD